MMKKLAALLLAAAMLLGVSPIAPAFALEAPGVTVTRDGAAVELVELGPDETVTLTASCPADWYIVGGAALQNTSAELELTWAALGFVQAGSSVQVAAAAADGEGNVWTSDPVTVTAVTPAQEPQLPQDPAEPQVPDAPVDIPAEEPPAAPEPVGPYEEMPVEDLYALVMSAPTYEESAAIVASLSEEKCGELMNYAAAQEPTVEEQIPAVDYANVASFRELAENSYVPVVRPHRAPAFLAAVSDAYTAPPDGLMMAKSTVANGDGTYTITLDAYTTGQVTTSTGVQPCDVILVLDKSSSMESNFTGGSSHDEYVEVSNPSYGKTYYIIIDGQYKKITYCWNCRKWTIGCTGYGYWHTPGTVYEPKTSGNPSGTQFYSYESVYTAAVTRMQALQQTAISFVKEVAAQGTGNRVAVVSFGKYSYFETGVSAATALLNASTQQTAIVTAINNISNNTQNATEHGRGMEKAREIFEADTETGRQRIVIMFTDGEPAPSGTNNWSSRTVKQAVEEAYTLKSSLDAAVYCVSVAPDSNAANPTSPMDLYMTYVSSNYPSARYTGTDRLDDRNTNGDSYYSNGNTTNGKQRIVNQITPGAPAPVTSGSFYLSASNTETLNSIFQQIATQTGGSTIDLGATAAIKDIISPYFEVPAGAQINVYTQDCTSYDGTNATWETRQDFTGSVNVSGDTLSVTGFDFSHNFVSATGRVEGDVTQAGGFHGRRLVIQFTVAAKDGFLGGNGVPTNGAESGIYDATGDVVGNFTVPTVDVPITLPGIENLPDVNTYLSEVPTEDTLKDALGDQVQNPFGELGPWQTQYVNISTAVTVDPKADNTPYDAMEDGQYSLTVTVTPKSGTGESQSAVGVGNILVYAPEITISDMEIPLGDTPNFTDTAPARTVEWKHDTVAASPEMGTAPALSYNFAPAPNENNYKADTYVTATVKIKGNDVDVTEKCKFEHANCTHTGCPFDPDLGQFIVHVIPFSLTIRKTGWDDIDENQSFVFTVTKDGETDFKPLEVVVHGNGSVTIDGLPKGTYTVEEESGWSWRYEATNATAAFTSDDINIPSKTVTVTNTRQKIKWLSGCAWCDNTWINGSVTSSSAPAEADNKSRKGVTD